MCIGATETFESRAFTKRNVKSLKNRSERSLKRQIMTTFKWLSACVLGLTPSSPDSDQQQPESRQVCIASTNTLTSNASPKSLWFRQFWELEGDSKCKLVLQTLSFPLTPSVGRQDHQMTSYSSLKFGCHNLRNS